MVTAAASLMLSATTSAGVQAPKELNAGDVAPAFTLQGTDGKTHKLSDYRGKQAVVIAWFPKAFTRGCTVECKSLAENGSKIRAYDVAYFMASVDPLEDNTKFAAEQKADFPLLSDPTKATAKAYGVLGGSGFASRWTYYIDIDGRILHIEKAVKVATAGPDVAAKLGELKIDRR
jgi:peroxiredoxin Q/BCP